MKSKYNWKAPNIAPLSSPTSSINLSAVFISYTTYPKKISIAIIDITVYSTLEPINMLIIDTTIVPIKAISNHMPNLDKSVLTFAPITAKIKNTTEVAKNTDIILDILYTVNIAPNVNPVNIE